VRILVSTLVAASGCLAGGVPDTQEPSDCTDATYACVSRLIAARCLTCHSAALTGLARFDAPLGVDFDTEEDVRRWRDRIRIRAIDAPTMPPGAPLPEEERALLGAYLDMLDALPCVPSCGARACGDDGCGGSCGSCGASERCAADGSCACLPSCDGRVCGDDGCGGTCGACSVDRTCVDGACECVPDCAGRACGDDGCGGSCGSCRGQLVCNTREGRCTNTCTPDCTGRICGDDGCGGSCGSCGGGDACDANGQCACAPSCVGKQCGDDGCGGSCGACPGGEACSATGTCDFASASFAADVIPIFQAAQCGSTMCHGGVNPKADLDLSTTDIAHQELLESVSTQCTGSPLVQPGDPGGSYLINKLTGTGMCAGSVMPKAGSELSSAQIDVVRAWIGSGAGD
jgi:hypothetical protein